MQEKMKSLAELSGEYRRESEQLQNRLRELHAHMRHAGNAEARRLYKRRFDALYPLWREVRANLTAIERYARRGHL